MKEFYMGNQRKQKADEKAACRAAKKPAHVPNFLQRLIDARREMSFSFWGLF